MASLDFLISKYHVRVFFYSLFLCCFALFCFVLSYYFILLFYFILLLSPMGSFSRYYSFQFSVLMGFLTVQPSESLIHLTSLGLISFCLFCSILMCYFCYNLVYFVLFYPIEIYLYYNERQSVPEFRWERRWEGTWSIREMRN